MTSRRAGFFLAAALFPSNTPLTKRIDVLSRHFNPKPGQLSEIDQTTLRDRLSTTKDVGKFGAAIKVSPPKGSCLTITTATDRNDMRICRDTFVKWSLDDINPETGTINWMVKTGSDDSGTPLSWKVPYVIAKVLPPEAEFFKNNSKPVYFKSCIASHGDKKLIPRKVTLTKFDNSKWVIRFPEKDVRNTSISQRRPGEVWGETYKPKKTETKEPGSNAATAANSATLPEQQDSASKQPPGTPDTQSAASGGSESPPAAVSTESTQGEPEPWTIDAGRAFEMSVENFISDVSMPPGRKGLCRYVFDHVPGNFDRGRIECHDTGQYRYVYAFLPCLGVLAPAEIRDTDKK